MKDSVDVSSRNAVTGSHGNKELVGGVWRFFLFLLLWALLFQSDNGCFSWALWFLGGFVVSSSEFPSFCFSSQPQCFAAAATALVVVVEPVMPHGYQRTVSNCPPPSPSATQLPRYADFLGHMGCVYAELRRHPRVWRSS